MNRSINTEVTILFLPRPRATQNPWPLSGRWQLAFQDNLITSATGSATEHSQEKPVSGCDSNAAHLGSSKRMEHQSPREARAIGGGVEKLLKAFLVVIALGMAGRPAESQSLQVAGIAGYLSEWELEGAVTERVSAGGSEFSGPVIWKHVGLCSLNGPQEKYGEISFQISGSGSLSRINATISLEGARCTYSGNFSDGTNGLMDCSDAKGVPLAFSFK